MGEGAGEGEARVDDSQVSGGKGCGDGLSRSRAALTRVACSTKTFTQIPEFQLIPLPATNPVLIGNR